MKIPHARAAAPGLLVIALLLAAAPTRAASQQAAVEEFLRAQTEGLPGRVEITLGRQTLPACAQPQAFLPTGVRPWGHITVGVRCAEGTPWTRYVAARVAVIAPYQLAARAIAAGETLRPDDAQAAEGDLTGLPAGVLTDPTELAGKVATNRIAAGAPLRRELLRGLVVVRQGQEVRVVVQGPGFLAGVDGKAMADAAVGATVQVRTRNGRTVTGTALADGTIARAP